MKASLSSHPGLCGCFVLLVFCFVLFLCLPFSAATEDSVYKQPAKPVLEALKALPTPAVSVSPQRDYAIFTQSVRYPSISEVAQPMLRLAGIRIDSNTNGMHLAANYTSFTIVRLSDGAEIKAALPHEWRGCRSTESWPEEPDRSNGWVTAGLCLSI
jgi:hypothetical protein